MKYTMIVGKYINLGTLQKLLFDDEKVIISDECIQEVDKSFRFLKEFSSDKIILWGNLSNSARTSASAG